MENRRASCMGVVGAEAGLGAPSGGGEPDRRLTRRQAVAAAVAVGGWVWPARAGWARGGPRRFPIGACDWSLGHRGDVRAMAVAARIGLDGVQVSFGPPGGPNDLREEAVRQRYAAACREHGVRIASLAMGVLNSIPYASDPRTERWVLDCIDVLQLLKVRVVLLAFFGKGDIHGKRALQEEVIRRLRRAAPRAEEAGVVLGIESWMDADEHLRILDAVNSPAVQVYYDVANMEKQGYDIYREIRRLGRERICEVHCKENGFLLGQGRVDFPRVKEALDDIGWSGWLIIEGAVGGGKNLVDSYTHNQKYLRSVFGGSH